jgi:hypothetical protein
MYYPAFPYENPLLELKYWLAQNEKIKNANSSMNLNEIHVSFAERT